MKLLTIILLSYNDVRVLNAIDSIRQFDDILTVKIIVKDGGSNIKLLSSIRNSLNFKYDILISEADNGIFEALNIAQEIVDTPFCGWLGSDDIYLCNIKASHVVRMLSDSDVFIADTVHVSNNRILRKTSSLYSGLGLVKYGFNNPHFSTFVNSKLIRDMKYNQSLRAADLLFFIQLFDKADKIKYSREVCTAMEVGGFSSPSFKKTLAANFQILLFISSPIYKLYFIIGTFSKFLIKLFSILNYKIIPRYIK